MPPKNNEIDWTIPNYSHTRLSTFRQCIQKYTWQYIEKLPTSTSVGQLRGTAGHAGLAEWYRTEKNNQQAMDKAWATWLEEGGELHTQEDWEVLERALNRYFAWCDGDQFEFIEEERFFNLVFEPSELERYQLIGYIDGVIRLPGDQLWLLENKFLKRVPSATKQMDAQVMFYQLTSRMMKLNPIGVMYNMVRMTDGKKAIEEPVVRRQILMAPDAALYYTYDEVVKQIRVMEAWKVDPNRPVYRNPTDYCSWGCSFYNICVGLTMGGSEEGEIERYRESRAVQAKGDKLKDDVNEINQKADQDEDEG